MELTQERALEIADELHKRWIEKFPDIKELDREKLITRFIDMWNYCNVLIMENHSLVAKSEEQLFKIDLINKNKVDILEQVASLQVQDDFLKLFAEIIRKSDILDLIKLQRCNILNNQI